MDSREQKSILDKLELINKIATYDLGDTLP